MRLGRLWALTRAIAVSAHIVEQEASTVALALHDGGH